MEMFEWKGSVMLVAVALASSLSASEASGCVRFADSEACDVEGGTKGSIMLHRHVSRDVKNLDKEILVKEDPWKLENDRVTVVTVETRGFADHQLAGPEGWANFTVHNVGAGKKWEGYMTKIELMKEYISGLQDDKLIVFVDGGDTMYGGCDLDDLVGRYEKLAEKTKAPIIAGAESHCFEGPCDSDNLTDECGCIEGTYPEHGRIEALSIIGRTPEEIDAWQQEGGHDWQQSYKFLNSGLIMGPVGKLREFYDETLAYGKKLTEAQKEKEKRIQGDQRWVQQIFQTRPDLVALDYTTLLVTNTGSRRDGMKLEKDGQNLFSFSNATGKWTSQLTGVPVCFFHMVGCCQEKDISYDKILQSGGFSVLGGVRPTG